MDKHGELKDSFLLVKVNDRRKKKTGELCSVCKNKKKEEIFIRFAFSPVLFLFRFG